MKALAMIVLLGVIGGCAPKSVPLTEESMNECDRLVRMTERVYLDKTPEEVLNAAARLFQLVDGGYTVTYTPDGLTAKRTWPVTEAATEAPADGSDTWLLTVKKVRVCTGGPKVGVVYGVEGDPYEEVRGVTEECGDSVPGIKLVAYHIPSVYGQGIVPSECFAQPLFSPGVSRFTVTPAIYRLFFQRMDYLLGKSAQWTDCKSFSDYIRNNIHYRDQFSVINFQGHLDGLCYLAKDRTP